MARKQWQQHHAWAGGAVGAIRARTTSQMTGVFQLSGCASLDKAMPTLLHMPQKISLRVVLRRITLTHGRRKTQNRTAKAEGQ